MIKVLFHGLHTDQYIDDHYSIDPLTSSVTLIRTNGKNILIDSGAYYHRELLLDGLKREELKPEDIDYVLNTHYHLDHTTNNFLFPNAFCGVGQNLIDHKTGKAKIYHNNSNPDFPEEISDLPTPGHMHSHTSYVYKEDGLTYVMAGDAISEVRFREGKLVAPDIEAFWKSAIMIFEIADVIIPGHFRTLMGDELHELHEIVKTLKP